MIGTILLAGIEQSIQKKLECMLREEYCILIATGFSETLEILRQKQTEISVILFDLAMPQAECFEFISAVQSDALTKNIPIIAVNDCLNADAEEMAVSLGAYGYIYKPFSDVLVKHLIQNAVCYRKAVASSNKSVNDSSARLKKDDCYSLQALNAIDEIPGGIATCTFQGDKLNIICCNNGFCRMFGIATKKDDYVSLKSFDILNKVVEEDKKDLLSQLTALVRHGIPMDCVFRIQGNAGDSYRWINEKAVLAGNCGDVAQFHAVLIDVTERQNALEQLRMSETESNLAVSVGDNIIMRYSIADKSLTLTEENASLYSLPRVITGVPEEQIRNGFISPESADIYTGFFKAINNGVKVASVVFQQNYFGEWRWMEGKSATVFDCDGKPIKAVISMFDVTDKIEKESVYRKWQQSLQDRKPGSYTLFRCNLNLNASYNTCEGTLLTFDFKGIGLSFNERTTAYVEHCVYEDDKDIYYTFMNSDTLLANYYREKRSDMLEYREKLSDGRLRWLRVSVDLVESLESTDVEAYIMYENIDEIKKAEFAEKLRSETDSLTGVLNRMAFSAKVNERLHISKLGERHALLMLDIDGFKQVNEAFGHNVGDTTLIKIAEGLRSIMRRNDLLCRIGGDEFAVFLCDVENIQAAVNKAKQICTLFKRAYSIDVQISASIGISLAPRDGMDFETLYIKADAALYYVKENGKNSCAYYKGNMAVEHLLLEPEVLLGDSMEKVNKKRRMLIVDDNSIDYAMLQNIFRDDFIIEKANDGSTALSRLSYYGTAISVVLLDLMMPGMDGFTVLEKMRENVELSSVPVLIVSGDESREACLKAIRMGAADFITKPIDSELLRIRVQSAISKAENALLRITNEILETQNEERSRYESVLDSAGVTFVEYNWLTGEFLYYPSISCYLYGTYDNRDFWQILLSDFVADTNTVHAMQLLTHRIAQKGASTRASQIVMLKTPNMSKHRFRVTVRKLVNEFQFTNKLIIALDDLDYDMSDEK